MAMANGLGWKTPEAADERTTRRIGRDSQEPGARPKSGERAYPSMPSARFGLPPARARARPKAQQPRQLSPRETAALPNQAGVVRGQEAAVLSVALKGSFY